MRDIVIGNFLRFFVLKEEGKFNNNGSDFDY